MAQHQPPPPPNSPKRTIAPKREDTTVVNNVKAALLAVDPLCVITSVSRLSNHTCVVRARLDSNAGAVTPLQKRLPLTHVVATSSLLDGRDEVEIFVSPPVVERHAARAIVSRYIVPQVLFLLSAGLLLGSLGLWVHSVAVADEREL